MNGKVIYTITFHHAHNYGAMLQAYALQKTVLSMGWDNLILDYSEDSIELIRFYRKNQSFRQEVIKHDLLVLKHYSEYNKRFKLMEKFYKKELKKTKPIRNLKQLKRFEFESHNFLVGSDQMWNFKGKKHIPEYLNLNFLNGTLYYCTYAISMGGNYIYSDPIKMEFEKLIDKTTMISVREKSMKENLEKLYKKDSVVVCDPIFLLKYKEWMQLAETAQPVMVPSKYILCFELVAHSAMQNLIDELREAYHLPVVVLTMALNSSIQGDCIIRAAGPKEFLRLIIEADVVISTSFHCAAFSIVFHKTIYSLLTDNAPTRICELMHRFGLDKGIIRNDHLSTYFVNETKWKEIDEMIHDDRDVALRYLREIEHIYK